MSNDIEFNTFGSSSSKYLRMLWKLFLEIHFKIFSVFHEKFCWKCLIFQKRCLIFGVRFISTLVHILILHVLILIKISFPIILLVKHFSWICLQSKLERLNTETFCFMKRLMRTNSFVAVVHFVCFRVHVQCTSSSA